jgi:hypothetical protein
MVAKQLQD